MIKNSATFDTATKSEFIEVKERDERYLILYQIEKRQKMEESSNNDSIENENDEEL